MDCGDERTIVITTETHELCSAEPEGADFAVEESGVDEAGVSNGGGRDVDGDVTSMHVQDVDKGPCENNVNEDVNHHNWMTAAGAEVLDVRCKTVTGQLHKARLGSGGSGRCILRHGKWYTPTEFEGQSGRAQSKDWKRSIRFGGKSLQSVIDAGLLLPHAASCLCATCLDDPAVSVPVKLFTPYRKRKFRTVTSPSSPPEPLVEIVSDDDGEPERPPCESEQSDLAAEVSSLPTDLMWNKLEEMSRSLLRQALCLKQAIRTCRERSAVPAASVDAPSGIEIATPPVSIPVQQANAGTKCANCNRPPALECGACHGATYCSRFCCEKDWTGHRTACRPVATTTSVMLILADGSDQLITVSQAQ